MFVLRFFVIHTLLVIFYQFLDQHQEFCTFDACVANDPDRSVCSSFEMFAAVCEEYNGDTTGWREATGCGKF